MAVSLIALAASAWALITWALTAASMLRSGGRYDFSTYYAAAYALRHNVHANIYDAHVLAKAGAAAQTFVHPPLPYTYPPLFAIVLSPFTLISFKALAALWQVLNDVIWLAITVLLACEIARLLRGWLLSSHTSRQRGSGYALGTRSVSGMLADPVPLVALALAALLCLPNEPGRQTVLTGQINFLVLLPLVLIPTLERHGHPRWAGAMVAIAAMLKFTPAILLLYFAIRRRWQVVNAALVVLAGLALVCIAVVGPGVALASVGQALHIGTTDASISHNEALLAPLLAVLTAAHPELRALFQMIEYGMLALLALFGGIILWRHWRSSGETSIDQEHDAAGYGIALCLLVLIWPTAWVHHYIWVLPAGAVALALMLAHLSRAHASTAVWRRAGLLLFTAICCFMLVVTLPHHWDTMVSPGTTTYLGLPIRPLLLSFRALGTLGLFGVLSWWYATAPARSGAARDMLETPVSGAQIPRQG